MESINALRDALRKGQGDSIILDEKSGELIIGCEAFDPPPLFRSTQPHVIRQLVTIRAIYSNAIQVSPLRHIKVHGATRTFFFLCCVAGMRTSFCCSMK
jgi:hypothetical protein